MDSIGIRAALVVFAAIAAGHSDELTDKVDALFEKFNSADSPGCAVGIARDGQVIYSKGYGSAQLEYAIPIQPDTVFHVASVSKQFTAMAVVLLAADGKLSLDDEARKYVSEIPEFDHPITIRHLLNHTSGIRDQWTLLLMSGWVWGDIFDTKDILKIVARQKELNFVPGDRYTYSNTGFTLLGVIAERASGKSLDEFCQERIFGPLGMAQTHFHMDAAHIDPGRAYSYEKDGEGFKTSLLNYSTAGATSLFTTVGDLLKWQYNFTTHQLGGDAAAAMMLQPGVLNGGEKLTYASGVDVGKYKGLDTISHGGSDAGFRSVSIYVPSERFGVAVFSNLASASAQGLGQSVVDIYLPDKLSEAPADGPHLPQDYSRPVLAVDSNELEKLDGNFIHQDSGDMLTFSTFQDEFRVIIPGDPAIPLFKSNPNVFSPMSAPAWMTFTFQNENAVRWTTAGGDDRVLERVGEKDESREYLAGLAGTYYSAELDVFYRFRVTDNGLVLRRPKNDERILRPTFRDGFAAELASFYFTRDADGKCSGVRISSTPRVRHASFRRVEGFD